MQSIILIIGKTNQNEYDFSGYLPITSVTVASDATRIHFVATFCPRSWK